MGIGRADRNRKRRVRRASVQRVIRGVKRYAWRITAVWCWAHIFSVLIVRRDVFSPVERRIAVHFYGAASLIGFAPAETRYIPGFTKIFWCLSISGFHWLQFLGLFLYVSLAPVTVIWNFVFWYLRKRGKIQQAIEKKAADPIAVPKAFERGMPISKLLYALLAGWLLLFANSMQRAPILAALILAASIFVIRLYGTTVSIAIAEVDGSGLASRIAWFPFGYLLNVLRQIVSGRIKDEQLLTWLRFQRRLLRLLRRISTCFHGKAAERRAALLVFLTYSIDLLVLGMLVIFFWALWIKLSNLPADVVISKALLASAARVIPGMPTPEGVKVTDLVQAGASLSGWLLFVLYVGPVASMFPVLQDRYLVKIREAREQLRQGRRLIYTLLDALSNFHARVIAPSQANTSLEAATSPVRDE